MPSERRIRVLVLIKGLGLGGAERLIADAAFLWDLERFHYRVAYLLPWKDHLVDHLTSRGIEVACLGTRRGIDPTTLIRLRSLITTWRPDLIHAHLPVTGILARLVADVPVVYTEHNLPDSYRLPTRILNRLTYAKNRAVAAVSEPVAAGLAGYPGPAPVTIPNGVAVDRPHPDVTARIRAELGVEAKTPLVVHVGNIRPHKGHETLIAAVALLVRLVPEVVVVSIGGEKRPGDLERVRNAAEKAGVADRLRFLGRRADARDFIAAADVVVNPADVEGLPVTLLEAMAMGRPVVATAVGGVPDIVIDGVTGRLVPPGDPERLARVVAEALGCPEARTWGEAAATLIADRYGLASMVRAYERLYAELVDAD